MVHQPSAAGQQQVVPFGDQQTLKGIQVLIRRPTHRTSVLNWHRRLRPYPLQQKTSVHSEELGKQTTGIQNEEPGKGRRKIRRLEVRLIKEGEGEGLGFQKETSVKDNGLFRLGLGLCGGGEQQGMERICKY